MDTHAYIINIASNQVQEPPFHPTSKMDEESQIKQGLSWKLRKPVSMIFGVVSLMANSLK